MGLKLDKAAPVGVGAPEAEIEVTPAMVEVGADTILREPGVADLGVFFSARDLAVKVYGAMTRARS